MDAPYLVVWCCGRMYEGLESAWKNPPYQRWKTLRQVWKHTHTAMNANSHSYERTLAHLWMPSRTAINAHSQSYERTLAQTSFASIAHFQVKPDFSASVAAYLGVSALSVVAFNFPFPQCNYFCVAPSHVILFPRCSALRRLAFPVVFLLFLVFFSDPHRFFYPCVTIWLLSLCL